MDYKERLKFLIKTDQTVDEDYLNFINSSNKILKLMLRKFNAKSGALLFFDPLEREFIPITKKGRLNNEIIKQSTRRKELVRKGNSICIPVMIRRKVLGAMYFNGDNMRKNVEKYLHDTEVILDGRFRYEHDSTGLKKLFSKYVGDEALKKILKYPNTDYLTGKEQNCSILFVDIVNFTRYCNQKSSERVMKFLNHFFSEMSKIISKNGGIIDKFIGDEIMVVFGSPLPKKHHSAIAIRTAKEMIKSMNYILNKFNIKQGGLAIGISSGKVITGSVGAEDRMQYTVVGRKVNLASRLTSLAGKGEIFVDGLTKESAIGYKYKKVGEVEVRGFGKLRVFKVR